MSSLFCKKLTLVVLNLALSDFISCPVVLVLVKIQNLPIFSMSFMMWLMSVMLPLMCLF